MIACDAWLVHNGVTLCTSIVRLLTIRVQLVSELHSSASILDEEYVEAGTLITVRTVRVHDVLQDSCSQCCRNGGPPSSYMI